ncbi:tyrosine-type recombinase/integrase [Herbidospora yilanensis]|uniref:tyrosine-type recombinase/integrase n=1 Tax=Herbidospora yilanensis TaxID=354426 RepID=UPI000783B0FC|nr:site-specific integrase [Herbidospora yilanensis]
METSLDIQFWKIRKREGRKKPYELRWRVGTQEHSRSFLTKVLAQTHQAKLIAATSVVGEAWDVATGEPVSWGRKQATWFDHATALAAREWEGAAANTRKQLAMSLVAITLAMVETSTKARRTRPTERSLRTALRDWAFRPTARGADQPEEISVALEWLSANSRPVACLAEDDHLRSVLAALGRKTDGGAISATSMRVRRGILYRALDYAVERKLININPLPGIRSRRRSFNDDAVSPLVVPTMEQGRRLLRGVRSLRKTAAGERGRHLYAFFSLMFFAGLRPGEATNLRVINCQLPKTGWGKLTLTGSSPDVGTLWTDDGAVHDVRGLKHRSKKSVRIVPIPPELVEILREHLAEFSPAPDGRIFYDGPEYGRIPQQAYGNIWRRARKAALTAEEYDSRLAQRPYDLRHAHASTLLMARVPVAEIARRLGHSIRVLLSTYAHWVDHSEDVVNAQIEAALTAETTTGGAVNRQNVTDGPTTGQRPDLRVA